MMAKWHVKCSKIVGNVLADRISHRNSIRTWDIKCEWIGVGLRWLVTSCRSWVHMLCQRMSAKCDMPAENGAGPLVVHGIKAKSFVSNLFGNSGDLHKEGDLVLISGYPSHESQREYKIKLSASENKDFFFE